MKEIDWSCCTGATETEKMDGKELAFYRVYQKDCAPFYSKRMSEEQRSDRRRYIRKVLLNYPPFSNLSNEDLDKVRLINIDRGYLIEDSEGYYSFMPYRQVSHEKFNFRKVRAMMPFEFLDLCGKDFLWSKYRADISDSRDFINKYIMKYQQFKEKGMGLYIYSGTKGSGKTMLSCCLVNEIVKRYAGSVKFINILDFIELTRKEYKGEKEEINAIHNAALLVLDDIGVQLSKEWIDTVLYRLINERYVKRLPTIYTSNIPVDQLKMDSRIIDRIESTTYAVKLPEESIRKATRQQDKNKLLEEIENTS